MNADKKPDDCVRAQDNLYVELAAAIGTKLKRMVPELSDKYGLDENTTRRVTASAAVEAGVCLEALRVGLATDKATQLGERVTALIEEVVDEHVEQN